MIKDVTLTIKGVTYRFFFDFNAIAAAEQLTNHSVNLLRALEFKAMTAAQLRALLYASLLRHQPDITLEDAGGMLSNPMHTASIVQAIADAYMAACAEPEEGDSKNE